MRLRVVPWTAAADRNVRRHSSAHEWAAELHSLMARMEHFRYVLIVGLVLACASAAAHAADDPPASTGANISEHLKAAAEAAKEDAKSVGAAVKEGAQKVAVEAKKAAHDVADATKKGAHKVKTAANDAAAKSKAAVKSDKTNQAGK
jgi:hypothetical protein